MGNLAVPTAQSNYYITLPATRRGWEYCAATLWSAPQRERRDKRGTDLEPLVGVHDTVAPSPGLLG